MNRSVGLIFLLTMAWCAGTETGNPPAINPDAIYVQKSDPGVRMTGEQGAVTPGNSELRIVNLDTVSEPVDLRVNKDGSFQVDLAGEFDHVYRLRARMKDVQSKPVNISGETVETNDCIRAEPIDTLTFSNTDPGEETEASLVLTNRCDEDVALVEQQIRLRAAPIELPNLDLPLTIEAGESLTIDVAFAPTTAGTFESIVMYSFDSPGRVVLDLVGVAPRSKDDPSVSSGDPPLTGVRAQLGVCYGSNTQCDDLPDPISSGYPAVKTDSSLDALGDGVSVDWMEIVESIDCPLSPCYLYQPRLAVGPDGSISVAAKVLLEGDAVLEAVEEDASRESGVWFGRYSADGDQIHQQLIDFRITTPVGFWRNTPTVAVDSRGVTFLANLV